MPFVIEHTEKGYCVYTQGADGEATGDPHGCHPTYAEARQQQKALYANVPDARKTEEDGLKGAPSEKPDGHKSPPKGYPESRDQYADPANYKYPIDSEEHVRAAWAYIHKADNRTGYSADELGFMEGRIRSAAKKYGIQLESGSKSEDGLIALLGGSVKAEGGGVAAGYLITFGGPEDADNSRWRDFFTKSTDFEVSRWPASSPVRFHHGLTPEMGKSRIDEDSELKMDEIGVFIRAQLKMRDDWVRRVYGEMIEPGKSSWSSGTAPHLVERNEVKREGRVVAHEVKRWPLGLDATITPTPADPRNDAYAIKSVEMPHFSSSESRPSLAELTERWLEEGEGIIGKYQAIKDAELKIGRTISASRMERLKRAHDMLGAAHGLVGAVITEGEFPGTTAATDGGSEVTTALGREMLRLKAASYRYRGGL